MSLSASRLERALGLIVGIAAIVAALAALYQAALGRRQARAAAWPYLGQSNSLDFGRPYVRTLSNQGIGPARIRFVRVEVDGKPVSTWTEAGVKLTGAELAQYSYSWVGAGRVLSPGSTDTLLNIPNGKSAVSFWNTAAARLTVRVCYCSVYDECWITADRVPDPQPVAQCPAAESPGGFRQ